MATIIETEPQAQRLARAILADVALYNEEALQSSRSPLDSLAAEIAEGRALFTARVAPSLANVFDRELSDWIARIRPDITVPSSTGRRSTPDVSPSNPGSVANPEKPALAHRSAEQMFDALGRSAPTAPQKTQSGTRSVVLGLLVVIAVAAAWYFGGHH